MNDIQLFLRSLIFDWGIIICGVAAGLMMFLGFILPRPYKITRYRLITYGARLCAIFFISLMIMAKAYWQVVLAVVLATGILLLQRKYYRPKEKQKQ
jgi:hypothetical protein